MNFGGGATGGGAGASAGPDAEEINTEQLAFQAVSGEHRLRLLPSPWPSDNVLSPTTSILSIASTKGLVAAAGPDTLVIATTARVRATFINDAANDDGVVSFSPEAVINIPNVNHVAFSSDESCLVVTATQGGGMAVYDTSALLQGVNEPAFQLSTDGQVVRQLLPNPNPAADAARYFVVVTDNGQMLLADMKERRLVPAASGSPIFHEKVSCACWSRLGKQIIAGLSDGTAVQIDQQGDVKASIPEPPQLAGWKNSNSIMQPITAIFWLDTHDFLIIHTPINSPDSTADDDSIYHLARRDKTTKAWTFTKLGDPCPPFGAPRKPAHHFIQRLREWPPSLSEVIVLSSTASSDIGMFTKSKAPLDPANPISDQWAYTSLPEGRRAAMPMAIDMGGGMSDTSPIGMAMDLSAKEKATRPIPTEESLEESPVELPALCVLDNQGMLKMWWVVYSDSIRQGMRFPDLIAAGGPRSLAEQRQATPTHAHPPTATSFSNVPMAGTNASAQGSSFGISTVGNAPSAPAFGGASAMGNRQSPWATNTGIATGATMASGPTSLGKPSFGSTSQIGSATGTSFGQVGGGMGTNKLSVWGSANLSSGNSPALPASGAAFGGNSSNLSPFSNVSGNDNKMGTSFLGGLESKAGLSSFAALGSGNKENQPSPFVTKPSLSAEPSGSTVSFDTGTSFGNGSTIFGGGSGQPSTFGTPSISDMNTSFGKPSIVNREETMDDERRKPAEEPTKAASSLFDTGPGGFKLGSTFKGDGTAKDDLPKPTNSGAGLFGNALGDALGDVADKPQVTTPIKKSPSLEEVPKLSDIPEAKPTSPQKEDKEPVVEDAPLPPDFTTWKPKPNALPPPIPPGFGDDFVKPASKAMEPRARITQVEEAPLPPDSTAPKIKKEDSGEPPLAGSPPVDLGNERFSEGVGSEDGGPPDDEDGWSDEDEEEEEDGEEGEDEEEDDDDDGDEEDEEDEELTPEIIDPKGLSAFEARLAPASPKREEQGQQDDSTTPPTDKKSSYTPAGLPKAPVMFPHPTKAIRESPRSPSPVRSATSPLRPMPSFVSQTQSSFGSQSQLSFGKPSQSSTPVLKSTAKTPPRHSQPLKRIGVPAGRLVQKPQVRATPPKPAEPDAGELEDEEDARVQAILSAPVEPTREVPPFLAHQDYVSGPYDPGSSPDKIGLGGQIERVYKDINSMVDTLALNARAMQGFVQGHDAIQSSSDRDRDALDYPETWVLSETEGLDRLLEDIGEELEQGSLEDVWGKCLSLQEENKEMTRIKAKSAEIRKQVHTRIDPEQRALQAQANLPLEAAAQQSGLRQAVQRVQSLLAKTEEQLSLLRADLASLSQSSSSKTGTTATMPTVEAVTNTVLKMTAMVEKKSGDIDVLESQIRRLGGSRALVSRSGGDENYGDDLASAMSASRTSHHSHSPSASLRTSTRFASSSPIATRKHGTPGGHERRKSLFNVSDADVHAFRAKRARRHDVCEALRELVEARGGRVVRVGEE